jgi:RNA polymerase sigma factor (sigma-70 family)
MATNQMSGFIQHLRRVLRDGAGLTDGQLLGEYLSRRDEAAIAALVRRHGPMVWGVCRRILHNHHDAEDAFQTTFLVLVRKAASIASRELLANWLYGVAHQTALKARATAAKRKGRERQATEMPEPAATQQDPWRDLQPLLDEELSRLPDKYRSVIVLCDLEGKTRKEAARQLGCPEGTVAGRLARARIMLAKRLTRRGVALSGAALAAVLSQQAASAGVPTSVVVSTIKAASLLAAGKAAATGAISVKVAALTEGVMKAMLFTKLKTVLAVMLILGFVATGATVLTCRTAAGQEDKPAIAEKPVKASPKQEKEKEGFTAWGKEVGGVQAGLGYLPGQDRAYRTGETVRLVVRVRNIGKKEVKFSYFNEFFYENPPAVTDGEGKPVPLEGAGLSGLAVLVQVKLPPGKEVKLSEMNLELRPASEKGKERPVWKLFGTGKFQMQYENVGGGNIGTGEIKFDPILSKLATGKLELEVKEAEKLPEKQEKEGFTAWGKEAGGLQAGLGYRPGEHRAYHIGETVTLVVRVRNLGKEEDGKPHEVKFQYLRNFFMEKPPTVTDGEGKPVHFRYGVIDESRVHLPVDVNLAPGKEIELYKLKFKCRPANESGNEKDTPFYGTGKFQIQYERVFGNSSAGQITLDSALSKLATGKLELEVKDAEKASPKQEEEKEGFTAWGKEVGGLQAGLGYLPGEKRAYSHGETVKLVVRVRNVGKEEVKFQYFREDFSDTPPAVTDGKGKQVPIEVLVFDIYPTPVNVILAPGKEIELYELKLDLKPASESGNKGFSTLYGTGKFQIQYEEQRPHPGIDKILGKLATGKLELEIKDAPKGTDAEKPAAKVEEAKTDKGSLADAIKAFDEKASKDQIGKDETPITEQEVIAGIRASERPKESAVTDKLYNAFKQIAETHQLPPGAALEAIGGSWDPGGSFVYDVWRVRVKMPKEDGGTYSFQIRERIIRSRTLQEELVRIEKERPALVEVDGGRLVDRVNDLKARIAKMKTN